MSELIYFVDGEYVNAGDAKLPLGDLAIIRGFGVFDFLRTYEHVPFMLREHVERLERSAKQIDIALPYSLNEIESIVYQTNEKNRLPNVGIRIVVTGGESGSFMMPEDKSTLSVLVHPIEPLPDSFFTDGASVITSDIVRFLPTVKSLNYLGAIMAVREAKKAGAFEAVYRTTDGYVTEGTRYNLFAVKDGRLVTPIDDILIGITRNAVIESTQGKYDLTERAVTYEELLEADEVFITSSTTEIIPISRVDGKSIGNGRAGECTLDILDLFHDYVKNQTGTS